MPVLKFVLMSLIVLPGLIFSACSSAENEKATRLNNEGIEFMDQQNYSSALVKFQEAVQVEQQGSSKSQIYRNLSIVYFNLDEADSSMYYSKKAFECVEKDSYLYLLNKAEYYLMQGKVKEAIPMLEKAKEMKPGEMETYSNLSMIFNGNYGEEFINLSKALKYASKAYELNPNPGNEEQLASVYFQMNNFKKATTHYLTLMKRFPEVKIYQLYAGNSMYSEGKKEEGIALMKEAAARDAECKEILNELMPENIE